MFIKETPNAHLQENEQGQRYLNQYKLMKPLGSGAYGTVWLATFDQDYAIKEVSKSKLRRQRAISAFGAMKSHKSITSIPKSIELVREEIAIMKKLSHPNIVKLYEVLDDPEQDSLFMVFELCSTILLDIKSCRPIKDYKNYFIQLFLGLEYLHANHIVHRDIKPDNIMIGKDGRLKIVDFGVSQMFSKSHSLIKSVGSPAFTAPELLTDQKDVDLMACDVWSMGVTLYCMCFGKLPFVGDSLLELYDAIKTLEPEYPTQDTQLLALLKGMLDKNNKTRFSMARLRQEPWLSSLDPCPTPVTVNSKDIEKAISLAQSAVVMMAVNKFKKSLKKCHSSII